MNCKEIYILHNLKPVFFFFAAKVRELTLTFFFPITEIVVSPHVLGLLLLSVMLILQRPVEVESLADEPGVDSHRDLPMDLASLPFLQQRVKRAPLAEEGPIRRVGCWGGEDAAEVPAALELVLRGHNHGHHRRWQR